MRNLFAKLFLLFSLLLIGVIPYVSGQTRAAVTYMGTWSSSIRYNLNEIVVSGGITYISLVPNNLNNPPASSSSDWITLGTGTGGGTGSPGVVWMGTWSSATAYVATDAVSYGGSSYVAVAGSTNQNPSSSTGYWNLLAQQGATGTTGSAGTTGAAGAAATITIGTTTTGAAGTPASVSNTGSSSAATLNFIIPQGVAGAPGTGGSGGTSLGVDTFSDSTFSGDSLLGSAGSTGMRILAAYGGVGHVWYGGNEPDLPGDESMADCGVYQIFPNVDYGNSAPDVFLQCNAGDGLGFGPDGLVGYNLAAIANVAWLGIPHKARPFAQNSTVWVPTGTWTADTAIEPGVALTAGSTGATLTDSIVNFGPTVIYPVWKVVSGATATATIVVDGVSYTMNAGAATTFTTTDGNTAFWGGMRIVVPGLGTHTVVVTAQSGFTFCYMGEAPPSVGTVSGETALAYARVFYGSPTYAQNDENAGIDAYFTPSQTMANQFAADGLNVTWVDMHAAWVMPWSGLPEYNAEFTDGTLPDGTVTHASWGCGMYACLHPNDLGMILNTNAYLKAAGKIPTGPGGIQGSAAAGMVVAAPPTTNGLPLPMYLTNQHLLHAVFGAAGLGHSAGAVPDPGTNQTVKSLGNSGWYIPCGPKPAFVQVWPLTTSTAGTPTVSITLSSTTAGNLLYIMAGGWSTSGGGTNPLTGISDTQGNTFTPVSSGAGIYIYVAANIVGGSDTITVTSSSWGTPQEEIQPVEYSGVANINQIDSFFAGYSGWGSPITIGAITTTQPNDLLVLTTKNSSGVEPSLTQRSSGTQPATYDMSLTTVGSQTGTVSFSGSDNTWVFATALKESSSVCPMATFGASGTSHAGGGVPDPGATAGASKFLREDAVFAVPVPTATMYSGMGAPALYPAHRYWRVKVISPLEEVHLSEVQFRAIAGTPQVPSGGMWITNSAYHSASNLGDGSFSTDWQPWNDVVGMYAGYDFGSPVVVQEVAIAELAGSIAPTDFSVDYSDDGTTWTTSVSVTGYTSWVASTFSVWAIPASTPFSTYQWYANLTTTPPTIYNQFPAGNGWTTVVPPPPANMYSGYGAPSLYPQHRYWRIALVTTLNTNVEMSEIQFRAVPGTIQAPSGGTWSASGGTGVTSLSDLDFTTNWQGLNGATLEYDFGVPVTVKEVAIAPWSSYPGDSASAFNIQYSDDNSTWVTASAVTGATTWPSSTYQLFELPATPQYTTYQWYANLSTTPPAIYNQYASGAGWALVGSGVPTGKITPPVTANFSWINQGTSTLDSTQNQLSILIPAHGFGSEDWKIQEQTLPGGTWTLTTALQCSMVTNTNFAGCAIGVKDAGNAHMIMFKSGVGVTGMDTTSYSSATSGTANHKAGGAMLVSGIIWQRIVDDGTNFTFYYSINNGISWVQFDQWAVTDYLTSPATAFFAAQSDNAGVNPGGVSLISWTLQ